jgi:prepilin-type N-terminal cleavage/methylation domain-containing protein
VHLNRIAEVEIVQAKAFTLVELMIVVSILGILAAIVIPMHTDQTLMAKESAIKSNLNVMRTQIELYRLRHRGTPPGYASGAPADVATLQLQFTATSAETGEVSANKAPVSPYLYGPYVKRVPENPFNRLSSIAYAADFATAVNGTSSGWLYKRETGEIRLNWAGADKQSLNYWEY